MTTERQSSASPRAVYDGKPSSPAPQAMPKAIAQGSPQAQMAWAMQQAGVERSPGDIDEQAYHAVVVTRDDARALAATWTFEVRLGRPGGYRGSVLLDELPDEHEAYRAVCTMVRCQKYEAQLQSQVPALQREVLAAQKAAEEAAHTAVAQDWERYQRQVNELANNPRTGGDTSQAILPPRVEPDLTEVRKAQARLDRLAGEIGAVRLRSQSADRIVTATMQRMAEASDQLMWAGPSPGITPDRPDWSAMFTAYDELVELIGKDKADQMMHTAVKRWEKRR